MGQADSFASSPADGGLPSPMDSLNASIIGTPEIVEVFPLLLFVDSLRGLSSLLSAESLAERWRVNQVSTPTLPYDSASIEQADVSALVAAIQRSNSANWAIRNRIVPEWHIIVIHPGSPPLRWWWRPEHSQPDELEITWSGSSRGSVMPILGGLPGTFVPVVPPTRQVDNFIEVSGNQVFTGVNSTLVEPTGQFLFDVLESVSPGGSILNLAKNQIVPGRAPRRFIASMIAPTPLGSVSFQDLVFPNQPIVDETSLGIHRVSRADTERQLNSSQDWPTAIIELESILQNTYPNEGFGSFTKVDPIPQRPWLSWANWINGQIP